MLINARIVVQRHECSVFVTALLFSLLLSYVQASEIIIDDTLLAVNYDASSGDDLDNAAYAEFPVDLSSYKELCIEFWTYWGNVIPQSMFFYGNETNHILITSSNGGSDFEVEIQAGSIQQNVSLPLSPDGWFHLAISINPESIEFIGYSNGQKSVSATPKFNISQIGNSGIIYLGGIPNATIRNAMGTAYYQGAFDEFRIWTIYRNSSVVYSETLSTLSGLEPGLLGYWKFNEQGDSSILYDSTPNHFNGNETSCTRILQTSQSAIAMSLNNTLYIINATETYSVLIGSQTTSSSSLSIQVTHFPATASLCIGNTSTCFSSSVSSLTTSNPFSLSFIPNRATCGQVESFSISSSNGISGVITVRSFLGTLNTANLYTISTEGGAITLNGYFGLYGNLDSNESVKLILNGQSIPCTNGTVSDNSNQLTCNVPAGVGANASIQLNLCNTVSNFPNAFSFDAPTINNIYATDSSNIIIVGSNFGPNRTFNGTYNYVKFNDSIQCDTYHVNQTQLQCKVSKQLTLLAHYIATVSIGGQITNFGFTYVICNPPCANNGSCIGENQCNCTNLPFGGSICNSSLSCTCDHGGVCLSKNLNGSLTYCQCEEGWVGTNCQSSVSSLNGSSKFSVALVAGVVGGVGGALIIASIVVCILVATRPKRGGKNFIPLEKKDFTKIIYGEQLDQSPEKTTADLKKLEELFSENTLELALVVANITQITEADKIAKALIIVYQHNEKVLQLLQKFISDEVKTSESSSTLFRSNSMVSKMFKFYSRLIGLPYLYETVGPEICELIEQELGLEVDPEKMEEGTDLDEMRWTLMAQSQKLLKSIFNSVEKCPAQFRILFAQIKECVSDRFPNSVNTTIGGFLFLRFFCPAISSPEAFGILDEPPSASARRLLILITKVLQSLSNDVEFGTKEPYMTKLNDFIHSNRTKLVSFYEKLVKPGSKPPVVCNLPKHMNTASLAVLANYLKENFAKIDNPSMKAKLEPILG